MRTIEKPTPNPSPSNLCERAFFTLLSMSFDFAIEAGNFLIRSLFIFFLYWRSLEEIVPNLNQIIQLSCLYFFAIIDLLVNILPNLLIFEIPTWLENIVEPIVMFLSNDLVIRLTSPDILYTFTILLLDLLVRRQIFGLSKLVRYNVLLVFALLMLQGVTVSTWDTLFNRQILEAAADWCWDQGTFIHTDKRLLIIFFTITFFFYLGLYLYCWFISSFLGKFPMFGKRFTWLTDSIFFWLKIRTSTMKYGKRKIRDY